MEAMNQWGVTFNERLGLTFNERLG
jgi:hypothetical protein